MKKVITDSICVIVFAAVMSLYAFASAVPASVGNHTDYGGTGGSVNNDYSNNTDYSDNSYDDDTSSLSSSSSGDDTGLFVDAGVVLVIILGIVFISKFLKKKNNNSANKSAANTYMNIDRTSDSKNSNVNHDRIISFIRAHDPDFSEEHFLSWSEQVFVQLQQAWTERDWKKARPFESEQLFAMHKSQLEEYIHNGTINIMQNVCVNESEICDYSNDSKYEYLTVFMKTRYNDYVIKEDTKQVVKGDPSRLYHVDYKLKFVRALGVQTGELSNHSTTKCPNCGASVDVSAAGQCIYCGTVITNGEHDWVLCNLDDVGQY